VERRGNIPQCGKRAGWRGIGHRLAHACFSIREVKVCRGGC
jgi:hypothetical protein